MDYINLHTHSSAKTDGVTAIVNQYPREFSADIPLYSIGIHPWYIDVDKIDIDLAIIEDTIMSESCLAVGECGLDKKVDVPFALQVAVFESQLALAESYRKPVIIHCVAAFQELIEIKNRLKTTVPMIIHGFSKKAELAKQLLDSGFYLSFGKYLLRNPELENVFQQVPADRIFLETDSIEESISDVYNVAAKYKQNSVDDLKTQIMDNFTTVFNSQKTKI